MTELPSDEPDGDVQFPRLPTGWPSDPSALTHSQLDDYGVQRKNGRKVLSLDTRQLIYYVLYLAPEDPPQPRSGPRKLWWVLGPAIAAVLAAGTVVAIMLLNRDDDRSPSIPTQPDSPEGFVAYQACQEGVKDQLKAPATAQFPNYAEDAVQVDLEGETFTITAFVDSENGFGALVRTDWICGATWQGGTTYDVSVVMS